MKLSRQDVARILIDRTGLGSPLGRGSAGALETIKHLGYVQIDTIAVVERAHHHILWNRVEDYQPSHLKRLQENDRTVFEYWTHALAYVPVSDWSIHARMMREIRSGRRRWHDPKPHEQMKAVLRRIKKEGPLGVSSFEDTRPGPREIWFSRKPAKAGLEELLYEGRLSISRRDGFEKIYDLTERVIPNVKSTSPASESEVFDHHLARAVRSFGVFSTQHILHLAQKKTIEPLERHLQKSRKRLGLIPVEVGNAQWWSTEQVLSRKVRLPETVRILSPFDPLVIQRQRLKTIFEWDYTIECYVPEPKRKYGYFCLPLLWNGDLVGRVDCKADRAQGRLILRSFHAEKPAASSYEFKKALKNELERFAQFNGCLGLSDVTLAVPKSRRPAARVKSALESPSAG